MKRRITTEQERELHALIKQHGRARYEAARTELGLVPLEVPLTWFNGKQAARLIRTMQNEEMAQR